MGLHVLSVVAMTVALMVTGCGNQSLVRPPAPADLPAGDRSILAGEWEYEDSAAVILQLDEQGNGTYPFKEGRFETLQFGGHTWAGKWYQKENDREGGFVVRLSADYTEGEGTWWYDRIGADLAPSEKGGTFHLSRKISHTNLSDTPPTP
jgi:hypothetical protein